MRISFAHQEGPLCVGVIREASIREAQAQIRNGEYSGAGGFDLHLSCLDKELQNAEAISKIVNCTKKPILALNYNSNMDYSGYTCTEEERVGLMLEAIKGGAAAMDMQGYTFDLKSKSAYYGDEKYAFAAKKPKEVVTDSETIDKQISLIEEVHAMGAEVLLSTHTGVSMNCEEIVEMALFVEKRKPDVLKIVTPCETDEQLAECFKTMITLKNELKIPVSFHCSGEKGKLSRIVNPLLGSYIAFCVDRYSYSSHTEQIHLKTAVDVIDGIRKITM